MAEFDMDIRDGMVIGGTCMPRYQADLGVKDGRIAKIGNFKWHRARKVIDAGGLNVAPGFVDLHTHYDAQLFWDPNSVDRRSKGVNMLPFVPMTPVMTWVMGLEQAKSGRMSIEAETNEMNKLAIKPLGIVHDFSGGKWRRVQRAEGYKTAMVNGEVTFDQEQCTGATPGRLLCHGGAATD